MFLFCPFCGNTLLVESAAAGMRWMCQTCPYVHDITQTYRKVVPLARKKVDDVLGGEEAWKNVDQTDAICPACNNGRAYFLQIQIRSADEPMSMFCAERARALVREGTRRARRTLTAPPYQIPPLHPCLGRPLHENIMREAILRTLVGGILLHFHLLSDAAAAQRDWSWEGHNRYS